VSKNEFLNRMKRGTTFKKKGDIWDTKPDENNIDYDLLNVDAFIYSVLEDKHKD